jgi:hypothetical protein
MVALFDSAWTTTSTACTTTVHGRCRLGVSILLDVHLAVSSTQRFGAEFERGGQVVRLPPNLLKIARGLFSRLGLSILPRVCAE